MNFFKEKLEVTSFQKRVGFLVNQSIFIYIIIIIYIFSDKVDICNHIYIFLF